MKKVKLVFIHLYLISITGLLISGYVNADFKIVIMQDNKGSAANFRPLLDYFFQKGVTASFVAAKNYPHAAKIFSKGRADGMFSGSGIAGCFIIKGLAYPVIRPVNVEDWSTYWAVVLAPKGTKRFTQSTAYFNDKKVIFCSLASSGEFFYHSIVGETITHATIMKASSHGSAIDTLSRGFADVAIVKNRVWDKQKNNYKNIVRVGEDPGENPDGTLIVSNQTDPEIIENISSILLGLNADNSAEAKLVKEKLKIKGYIKTDLEDFKFTIALLKKAGVDKSFNFAF